MPSPLSTIKLIRLQQRLQMFLGRLTARNKRVYVTDRIVFYKQMWRSAATSLGADFTELTHGIWEVRRDGRQVRISGYKVPIDDPVTLDIAGDKILCGKLLAPHDIPMPDSRYFNLYNFGRGVRFFEQQDSSVVVKPASGTAAGRGVTTHINTYREFIHAVALASIYGENIITERMLHGELYRLLFLEGQLINAARRTGVRVTGNGHATINDLLIESGAVLKHPGKARIQDPDTADRDYDQTLAVQGLHRSTILPDGQTVLAKALPADVSDQPETIPTYNENLTEGICPAIVRTACKAVRCLKIRLAGVDIVTLDPSLPLEETGGGIIEVNTTPGLHHHYNLQGSTNSHSPAEQVLDYLLVNAYPAESVKWVS